MPSPSSSHSLEVSCQDVKKKLDAGEALLLLDCREQEEYQLVHISQAQLLPMSEIMERVGEIESYRTSEIVVHCHHGGRSMKVTQWLRQQGFTNVKSMAGGIDVWAQEIDSNLARY